MPRLRITPETVATATCPAGKARLDLFDTELPGFGLEVRASGGRTWYARYRNRAGTLRQIRLGTAAVLDVATARKEARRVLMEASLGRDPLAERQADRTVRRFEAFVTDSYLPYARTYKASVKSDESLLRRHLLPRFGRKPMNGITRNDIVMMHQARRNEGAAPGSANRLVILMKFIFNLAPRWEEPGITQNPARGVRLFVENNQLERFLTADETRTLLAAVERSSNPQLRYIIPMLVLTGARKREVLSARWVDFDTNRRFWRIPLTKSGRARHVPLSDAVLQLLAAVPPLDDCPWVFANPETRKPFADIFFPWNKARKAAGLPDLRVHDLRHSFASFLVNAGRSLYEVQKLLGHSQIHTTQRYAHLAPGTLLDAANSAGLAAGLTLPSLPAPPRGRAAARPVRPSVPPSRRRRPTRPRTSGAARGHLYERQGGFGGFWENQIMSVITIDGKSYELDLLSPKTRDNIRMLRQTDQEIQRLETQLAIVRTARLGYVNAVKQGVETYPRRPDDQVLQ